MKEYSWCGTDTDGKNVSGIIMAGNAQVVKAELQKKSILDFKISKTKNSFSARIKPKDLTTFFSNLSTLISSNISITKSLNISQSNCTNKKMKSLINSINHDISQGSQFSDTLKKHPKIFNHLIIGLISNSENNGKLSEALTQITKYLERSEKIKKKIKKAMTYPSIVLFTVILTLIFLITFIIPEFEKLFSMYNTTLPMPTLMVINISTFFSTNFSSTILAFLILPLIGYWIKRNSSIILEKLFLKIPFIGNVKKIILFSQCFRALSISVKSNIPLVTALSSLENITKNQFMKSTIQDLCAHIKSGDPFYLAMQKTEFFPSIAIQMIQTGEELGNLYMMLEKLADFYDEEIDNMIANINNILEPIIMLVLGGIVGGFLITMYLPIFRLGSIF